MANRPHLRHNCLLGGVMSMTVMLSTACAAPSGSDAVAPLARPTLQPSQPGREVAGSRIRFPASVAAGERVDGLFPAGSTVESRGERFDVDASGRLQLQAPSGTDTWELRVHRPGHPNPFVMKVSVDPAAES